MKNLILFLLLFFYLKGFSQKINNDTITITSSLITGNWGHKIDLGATFLHLQDNKSYFDVPLNLTYSVFYKNYNVFLGIQTDFEYEEVNSINEYMFIQLGVGYTYDFSKHLGIYGSLALCVADVMKSNKVSVLGSGNYKGSNLGFGLNYYLCLNRTNFIILSPKINYIYLTDFEFNTTGHVAPNTFESNYGFFNVGFSIAYKGFTSKRID